MDVSVIIVNYNVGYFLEQCLRSLDAAAKGVEVEILVVDNHSSDGSIAYLVPKFPKVRFIPLSQNMGFAASCNIALRESKGRYVFFLNPDTILPEDTIKESLAFFADHPDAGALGYRMVDGEGAYLRESKRGFPGLWSTFCKFTGLTACFPASRIFARYYLGHLSPGQTAIVDVLSGAALMIPATVLQRVGSFDERFFMYGEDIDLSFRIQLAGYHNYYLPRITLLHFKGESTLRNADYYKRFYGAMDIFVQKYRAKRFSGLEVYTIQLLTRFLPKIFRVKGKELTATQVIPNDFQVITMANAKASSVSNDAPILFCPGPAYSYKDCISDLEQLGSSHPCYFHGYGTHSIVGASRRSKRGESFLLTSPVYGSKSLNFEVGQS